MNPTHPRRTGYLVRRTVLRDSLGGLAGLGLSGLTGAFTFPRAFGQKLQRPRLDYDGWICPYDLIGATADPLVYYYYAGDCPTDDGQYYAMTSPAPLSANGGCPNDASTDPDCYLRFTPLMTPSKQLPVGGGDTLIDRSKNPMKHHTILAKNGIYLGRNGLPKLGGAGLTIRPNTKNGTATSESRNYQMIISNRRRAVRVFLLNVTAGATKKHVKVGIGQEIDADPTGLPVFDDERGGGEPKHYIGYMSNGDQFYHILTKN